MADPDISIALNRFGFGARPGEAEAGDPRRWLLTQFDRYNSKPAQLAGVPDRRAVAGELADYLDSLRGPNGLRQQRAQSMQSQPGEAAPPAGMAPAAPMSAPATPEAPDPLKQARQFARRTGRDAYSAAVGARMNISLVSDAPFVERLVHFWANHFAVSADKLTVIGLSGLLEFEAIRPHVLGKFGDMLAAVERHPAMLLYLDQAQSIGPGSMIGTRVAARGVRKVGLNENLAREILELHTLGVRSGYGQADVTEFARAMTGWTVAGIGRGPGARLAGTDGEPGDFVFAERVHEPGARTILGKNYDQAGEAQAAAVLGDLATHPATAQHIATKLARHFAGDTPPPALVARLQAAFLKSGGDLPTVYRTLIDTPEAWASAPAKFKTPWEWSVSTMRALGTREVAPVAAVGLMNQLGQPVWRPGAPAGYDDIAASWAGPDAVMRRVEAAERFATRSAAAIDARALAPKLYPATLSPVTAQALARAESPGQALALLLVAPESLREVRMFDRRQLLIGATLAAFAPRVVLAKAETDRRFVFIIQRGAADGLGTLAPVGDPAFAGLRGPLAEDFGTGAKLDAMFALHPSLATVAGLYGSGEALFAHAVASPYRDRSHFDGQNVLESGGAGAYQVKDGWLNRLLSLLPAERARAIAVSATVPLALRGPHDVSSYAPSALPDASDDLLQRVSMLYQGDAGLHALWSEAMATRTLAGDLAAGAGQNAAATGALAAKLLAPADGARIAMIETGGWDTHAGQRARLGAQLKGLDAMVGALKTGLGPLWADTMVLVATEFGRTAQVNGTGGTDHGTGAATMLLGGAVKGGRVVADWPGLAPAALYENRDLKPTTALDALIAGAVAAHFGIDERRTLTTLFPGAGSGRAVAGLVRA